MVPMGQRERGRDTARTRLAHYPPIAIALFEPSVPPNAEHFGRFAAQHQYCPFPTIVSGSANWHNVLTTRGVAVATQPAERGGVVRPAAPSPADGFSAAAHRRR